MNTLLQTFDTKLLMQAGTLTALCSVAPLIQTFLITWIKYSHPEIEDNSKKEGGTIQNFDYLFENYKKLVRGTLPGDESHKHRANILYWLNIAKMNTNNFSPVERKTLAAERMRNNNESSITTPRKENQSRTIMVSGEVQIVVSVSICNIDRLEKDQIQHIKICQRTDLQAGSRKDVCYT
jgi:hypothetical protein